MNKMAGSKENAPLLFGWLFRWFLLPHELTHSLQEASLEPVNHAGSEQLANDVAVAFWMEQPDGSHYLAEFERVLADVSGWLPLPVQARGEEEIYFNEHYGDFPKQQATYGAFQVRFILRSLSHRQQLEFNQLVRIR